MKKLIVIFIIIVAILFVGRQVVGPHKGKPFKRVIYVTIDTLRADHLKSYGYLENTAPFIEEAVKNGVVFTNVFSQIPHTAPSHASMFTGLYPFQHGVLRNHETLNSNVPNLYKQLSAGGIEAVAFPSVNFLNGKVSFPPSPVPLGLSDPNRSKRAWYLNASEVVKNAISWLDQSKPDDFFVWLHFYDVHQWAGWGNLPKSYRKAAESKDVKELIEFVKTKHNIPLSYWKTEERLGKAIVSYDARIRFVDDQLKVFFEALDSRGLNDGSVWIITSDHGEGLGNHNFKGHGEFLYQEQLHVPLVVFSPGGDSFPHHKNDNMVELVDIYPTISELMGLTIENSANMPGQSFVPLLSGSNSLQSRFAFAQRRPKDLKSFRRTWEEGEIYALHDGSHKLIDHSNSDDEWYDLKSDPFEEVNNYADSVKELPSFKEYLGGLLSTQKGEVQSEEPELNTEELDELRSLGYL